MSEGETETEIDDAPLAVSETPEPVAPPPPNPLDGSFAGRRWRVFWLAIKAGFLTVLTLGFYRFWMKTRLRRWYWSAIRIAGVPLEYVGDPLEKLLGFLIAVVFLAFYIGVVNLLLMFASFSLFEGAFPAYFLSFIGVIPLWFYAMYRARRYVLARTRWRGIRFGLEPGAWGYAWRAMLHWLVTFVTLGLLWPRMTFWLEKYKTDRTYFGSHRLTQGGRWQSLWPAMLNVYLPVIISTALFGYGGYTDQDAMIGLAFLPLPWLGFGLAFWRARSFAILTNTKSAEGIGFDAKPRPWRVFRIYLLGYGLAGTVSLFVFVPLVFVALAIISQLGLFDPVEIELLQQMPQWMLAGSGVALYFALFLTWDALRHTFVTVPMWRHFSETLTVLDFGGLDQVTQRARDEFDEAEGFAEALDVGAGI